LIYCLLYIIKIGTVKKELSIMYAFLKKERFLFSDIQMTLIATQVADYQRVYKIKGRSRH